MLSTAYRLRLEGICKSIAAGTEVSIDDMIWAQKLAKSNTSARGMVNQARRLATDPDSTFLKYLDIGDSIQGNTRGVSMEQMILRIGFVMINDQTTGGNETNERTIRQSSNDQQVDAT